MEYEEIKAALALAVAMRPPRFEDGTSPKTKIGALEDYLLESAFMQAELEEAIYMLDVAVVQFKRRIETMTGYEPMLPAKPQARISQADVLDAKRKTDPPIFEAGAEAKQLREGCLRQIDRFRWEAGQGPISRAYTLITGG